MTDYSVNYQTNHKNQINNNININNNNNDNINDNINDNNDDYTHLENYYGCKIVKNQHILLKLNTLSNNSVIFGFDTTSELMTMFLTSI
jgi:polysaccharide deacetylase 2 family uncharacterized protein YibQ